MAWVWSARLDTAFEPAKFDYSSPIQTSDALAAAPLDASQGLPIFRTRTKVARFNALHCPPVGSPPAVDDIWRAIILQFVPSHLVQFYPITLIARDGVSEKFSWVIPFSRVRCIDPDRSDVALKIEKPNITLIFDCDYYVHHEDCLGDLHLARDEQMLTHLVLSDALRDALAGTGESSMFFSPGKPADHWQTKDSLRCARGQKCTTLMPPPSVPVKSPPARSDIAATAAQSRSPAGKCPSTE